MRPHQSCLTGSARRCARPIALTNRRQKAVRDGLTKAGLAKRATCHAFRQTLTAHLVEDGCDTRVVQEVLGHKACREPAEGVPGRRWSILSHLEHYSEGEIGAGVSGWQSEDQVLLGGNRALRS